jgi:uncharacterized protein YukE
MNRYSVDLEQLLAFTERLQRFNARAEEIATAVDRQIAELHGTWLGVGAESQQEYHQTWMGLSQEMRESADFLRESAARAHRNYTGVAEHNSKMWP